MLGYGATHVIVGSSLFRDGQVGHRRLRRQLAERRRDRIIAAVDSRGGHVDHPRLAHDAALTPVEAVRALEPFCDGFLCTLVDGEGLMQGIDMDVGPGSP